MKKSKCTLRFYISTTHIMDIVVDTEKKFSKATYVKLEKSASPIVPAKERNYSSLERRLQLYMQSDAPLPVLIEAIDKYGIHVDYHTNLNMEVIYWRIHKKALTYR